MKRTVTLVLALIVAFAMTVSAAYQVTNADLRAWAETEGSFTVEENGEFVCTGNINFGEDEKFYDGMEFDMAITFEKDGGWVIVTNRATAYGLGGTSGCYAFTMEDTAAAGGVWYLSSWMGGGANVLSGGNLVKDDMENKYGLYAGHCIMLGQESGKYYNYKFTTTDTDEGVRASMYVDGELILDVIDANMAKGNFAFIEGDGTTTFKVKSVVADAPAETAPADGVLASFKVNADGTLTENGLKNVTNGVEGDISVADAPDGTKALALANGSAGSYVYFVVEAFDASQGGYTVEVDFYDNQSLALQAWEGEFTNGTVIGSDRIGGDNNGEWLTLSYTLPESFINRIGGGTGDFRYIPAEGYDSSDASQILFIKEVRIVEPKEETPAETAPATQPAETAPATQPAETAPATTPVTGGISVIALAGAAAVLAGLASKKRK